MSCKIQNGASGSSDKNFNIITPTKTNENSLKRPLKNLNLTLMVLILALLKEITLKNLGNKSERERKENISCDTAGEQS